MRLHLLATTDGKPVEYRILPGSIHDMTAFKDFDLDLPTDSVIYADAAYTDYNFEDILEDVGVELSPMRKKNSKRPISPARQSLNHTKRKYIETVGSCINRFMPKAVHSVTRKCFELKVFLFLAAYIFNTSL